MHPNCDAVNEILQAAGLPGRVRVLDQRVTTARAAAHYLGCPVGAIANSLIFETDTGAPLLIMTSGAHRVDMAKVGEQQGLRSVAPRQHSYANTPASRSEASLPSVIQAPSARSSIARSLSSMSFGLPAASRTQSFP